MGTVRDSLGPKAGGLAAGNPWHLTDLDERAEIPFPQSRVILTGCVWSPFPGTGAALSRGCARSSARPRPGPSIPGHPRPGQGQRPPAPRSRKQQQERQERSQESSYFPKGPWGGLAGPQSPAQAAQDPGIPAGPSPTALTH